MQASDISDSPLTFYKKTHLHPAEWVIMVLLLAFFNLGINCSLVLSLWMLEFISAHNWDAMSIFFFFFNVWQNDVSRKSFMKKSSISAQFGIHN